MNLNDYLEELGLKLEKGENEVKTSQTHVVHIPIKDLIIKKEPEKIDKKLYEKIKESISQYGILNPILVTKTPEGLIIQEGHIRYQIAKELGFKTVPCLIIK